MAPRDLSPPFRLRAGTSGDLAVLVRHRSAMWRELRRYPERDLAAHEPAYRRWLLPRLRSGEVLTWVAETRDGTPAATGALWFQPTLPRPGMPQRTSPYVFTMFTEPGARGRGLATRIVRAMIAVCRARRFPRVLLHASPQGRPVYRKLGFERTWEMRYWIDRRQAVIPRRRPARPSRTLARRRAPR